MCSTFLHLYIFVNVNIHFNSLIKYSKLLTVVISGEGENFHILLYILSVMGIPSFVNCIIHLDKEIQQNDFIG